MKLAVHVVCCLLLLCGVSGGDGVAEQERVLLQTNGIECDVASLRLFFASMNPQGDAVARTKSLVADLGDASFKRREAATTALISAPRLPLDILSEATSSIDPEIRWRSELILEHSHSHSDRLLRAALKYIEQSHTKGLATGIVNCADFYDEPSLQRLAQEALVATVEASDSDTLRQSLQQPGIHLRELALRGLVQILGDGAAKELRLGLNDKADRIRLFAAVELANQSDRHALFTLAELLSSDDVNVRSRSVQLLRKFTSQNLDFVAYDAEPKRDLAAKAWRAWLQGEGATAELASNVVMDEPRVGRILACYYDTNRVVEYDEAHNVVWETTVPQPWGCFGMPNGHRLIASYESNAVIEFDASGKEVWRATFPGGNPTQAQRLDNGNTLISLYSRREAIEITPDKKTVNRFPVGGSPPFVQRTEDGHTIVTVQSGEGVVEFDHEGKRVATLPLANPFSARRLSNGNLLVALSGTETVQELNADHETVWSKAGYGNILDAFRMDNGHTLIAFQGGVAEIAVTGETIWSDRKGSGIRVCYY